MNLSDVYSKEVLSKFVSVSNDFVDMANARKKRIKKHNIRCMNMIKHLKARRLRNK